MYRCFQILIDDLRCFCQTYCNETLHVRGAAAKKTAACLSYLIGVGIPILTVNRYYVRVARQCDSASVIGANGGKQIGFSTVSIINEFRSNAVLLQISLDEFNQLQV